MAVQHRLHFNAGPDQGLVVYDVVDAGHAQGPPALLVLPNQSFPIHSLVPPFDKCTAQPQRDTTHGWSVQPTHIEWKAGVDEARAIELLTEARRRAK
jgi:hypothetical protein